MPHPWENSQIFYAKRWQILRHKIETFKGYTSNKQLNHESHSYPYFLLVFCHEVA